MPFEESLIDDFKKAANAMGLVCTEITVESLRAPHTPPKLPTGKCVVYVFSLSLNYGACCAAGQGRVLKVGKAGPNSGARFQYQHYNGCALSSLPGMLLNGKILWSHLGITDLAEDAVGQWIKTNTDRYNIYLPAGLETPLLDLLERYIRGRLGPVFEG